MDYLYSLIIKPIEYLIEIIFSLSFRLTDKAGISVIFVSIMVCVLTLPLYNRAEKIQRKEREKQKEMSRWVDHINRTFRKDERFMMLSAFYKEQHYHPIYALRSSFSLLLQIPFFIAAYHYLSTLPILEDAPFLMIRDLSRPDGIIGFSGSQINLLPVLMTVINAISATLYLKGFSRRDKLQQYGMALIFLVLLYNSPSGLVLYWLCNNLFSLFRNLLAKFNQRPAREKDVSTESPDDSSVFRRFLMGALILTLLIGVWIPASVIRSSVFEFVDVRNYMNPVFYVLDTLCVSAGLLLLWGNVFFYLATPKWKKIIASVFLALAVVFVVNHLFFGRSLGFISTELTFDTAPSFAPRVIALNAIINILLFVIVCHFTYKGRLPKLVNAICVILVISVLGISISNCLDIQRYIATHPELKEEALRLDEDWVDIPLSRTGKNVVFIMLDRAASPFLPFIMAEKPELTRQFDGFTYYPNTISFATSTNIGTDALFGGYEYTPTEIDKRSDELLVDKHNEALMVMPVVFWKNGCRVTICDAPLANYTTPPDLSIFDQYDGINTYITMGRLSNDYSRSYYAVYRNLRKRNFLFYSLFKCFPLIARPGIYDDGNYLSTIGQFYAGEEFNYAYPPLEKLINFTKITDDPKNSFFMIDNETSHGTFTFQLPDYTPSLEIDNSMYNTSTRTDAEGNILDLTINPRSGLYHSLMISMLRLGEWFQYLQDQNVYDNTRIIIAADHGYSINLIPDVTVTDATHFNPLMMVKDFHASGFKTSNEFMTLADVPTLAFSDIIENPINPFTGRKVDNSEKAAHPQTVVIASDWHPYDSDKLYRISKQFTVHTNLFQGKNWASVTDSSASTP